MRRNKLRLLKAVLSSDVVLLIAIPPAVLALQATLAVADQGAPGWHVEAVDSEGSVGSHTSLALDADGYPHISYYDDGNGGLKYASYSAWKLYLPLILKRTP